MASAAKRTRSEDEGKRILNAVRRLVRALRLFDREAQTKHGMSAAQVFVLHTLSEEEVLSLNELAERTATDQSSASVVVQRLVDGGFVTRTAKREDRRHLELRITAKGRAVLRRSPLPAQQKILAAVAAMAPRDRKSFAKMFDTFVEEMGAGVAKAPMLFEDDTPKPRRRGAK